MIKYEKLGNFGKRLLFILLICGIYPSNVTAQNISYKDFSSSLKSGDSILTISIYEQYITHTKSKDSINLFTFLMSSVYPSVDNQAKLYDLTYKESEIMLDMAYQSIYQFMMNTETFVNIIDLGIQIAKIKHNQKYWFRFFTAKASFAMMKKDPELLSNAISNVKGYDYTSDSIAYSNQLYFEATLRKITNDSTAGDYYKRCINILSTHIALQSDSATMAATCTDYGSHLSNYGNLNSAIKYYIKGLKHLPKNKRFGNTKIGILSRIARTYLRLENTSQAKKYIHQGLNISELNNYKSAKLRELNPILGDISYREKKYQQAIDHYSESYQYADQNRIDYLKYILSIKIALTHLELENIEEARSWYNLIARQESDNDENKMLSFTFLSKYASKKGKYNEAIIYAKKTHDLAISSGLPYQELSSINLLYHIHKKANKSELALQYHEEYQAHRDVLYRQGQEAAVNELESEYQISLKEEKIASLSALNEAGIRIREGQQILIIAILGALLILSFLFYQLRKLNYKLKQQNSIISVANNEKEILLKEIHHRVKNNLQVISSLLKLQSRYVKDDNAVKAISAGRTRVQSMALLHQSLYSEKNLKAVEMKSYFENLIQSLFDTYNIEDDKIHLQLDIDHLILDVDTVIPLGLITNELISNALKHAFIDRKHGHINVTLKEIGNTLVLIIKDDGVGMDKASREEKNSFGEMLIDSLCQKLEGTVWRSNNNGSEIKIIIRDFQKLAG